MGLKDIYEPYFKIGTSVSWRNSLLFQIAFIIKQPYGNVNCLTCFSRIRCDILKKKLSLWVKGGDGYGR